MHRFFVHLLNGSWMVLVFVAVPTITSKHIAGIRLSAMPEFRMLTLGGLGIGLGINLLAGVLATGKNRRAYLRWTIPYAAALLVYALVFSGTIQFDWFRNALLWLRKVTT